MELSIVILNYQNRELLKQCLHGISASELQLTHEIIVVDNNSGDGTPSMIQDWFPDVRMISSPVNGGCAFGNNLGLLAARGQYVLVLNPDIAVFPGTIEALVQFMNVHPTAAMVVPKLENPDGSIQMSCFRFPDWLIPVLRRTPLGRLAAAKRHLRSYLMLDWPHDHTRTVDWVLGACMLVRNSAIEAIGLMDERFFMYFEDVDWCRRFWQAGYSVYYYPEVSMIHYHQRLSAENPGLRGVFSATTRVHIASGISYFMKYGFRGQPKNHEALQTRHIRTT